MDSQELYIDSVSHDFDGKTVLNGVYLTCKPGEIIGLLGRNGAGKSTLLKIIFGSLKAKYKFQRTDGQIIQTGYSESSLAYLPQDSFIPGKLRVREVVSMLVKQHREELLAVQEVTAQSKMRFRDLSGGNQRFIECLLLIYSDAKYVLLDEPFSQLSPVLVEKIQEHMLLMHKYKGFILTDHYYRNVAEISTRMVLLHNGSNYNIRSKADLLLHGYLPADAAV